MNKYRLKLGLKSFFFHWWRRFSAALLCKDHFHSEYLCAPYSSLTLTEHWNGLLRNMRLHQLSSKQNFAHYVKLGTNITCLRKFQKLHKSLLDLRSFWKLHDIYPLFYSAWCDYPDLSLQSSTEKWKLKTSLRQLTDDGDTDSSIVSCANCVYRNTSVHSIFHYSGVKHTWTAVANKTFI